MVSLLVAMAGTPSALAQNGSTSPLEILNEAPKVRFDEPEPTPRPAAPVPYIPPRGPAPPIQPVAPAFTPYSGESVIGRQVAPQPGYGQPTVPAQPPVGADRAYIPAYSTPTPRPVLGPDDVEEKEKKGGFVRGLIRAIPFVGGDDDEEEQQSERMAPIVPPPGAGVQSQNQGQESPIYRGYDAPTEAGSAAPLLLPPGATPIPRVLPGDPEPSSPPILTPEPRYPVPDSILESPDRTLPDAPADGTIAPPPSDNAPLLTVKRESDTTGTQLPPAAGTSASDLDTVAPADEKKPSVSSETPEPEPVPLERATTGVLIQDSRPGTDGLGPVPDSSATPLESFDPSASAAPAEPTADIATSLTVKQSDLGMPNPTYEQNTTVLAEFQEGVRKARIKDYAAAAQIFRAYALNHPSSGLAPRAYFLSIIFEKNRARARENKAGLERLFPESRYVKAAAERRPDLETGTAVAETEPTPEVNVETPAQTIARLERELTLAIGDVNKEPSIRADLGVAYLEQEEYARAYEVLRPAVEMSAGTPTEAEVLLAMGRVLIAQGQTVQAISLYESVEQKNPSLIYKDAESAWNVGLAFEGAGRYNKARSIYNTIRQRWPATSEAGWASKRLTDLAALRQ